jgi:hypothetical protein
MPKIEQRNYSIAQKTLEEVIEQVRLVLSYDGDVSKVIITRGNILAEYIVEDEGPPYGKLPESPVESIGDVLAKIELEPVGEHQEVDLDALAVIASALIQARKAVRTGIAWLTSDQDQFRKWIGVEKPISRLLGVPVYVVDAEKLPGNKLVLLCGRTSAVSPLKGDFGVIMDMGD